MSRNLAERAVRKPFLLDTVTRLEDLRVPPGNPIEALGGDRRGQHSIRVNEQMADLLRLARRRRLRRRVRRLPLIEEKTLPADIPMPHPSVVLREEFLEPVGLTVYALAKSIHVTRSRINEICNGRQGITAAIALRLGRFFGVDPQWFMNMQSKYDLLVQSERLKAELAAIEPRTAA
jgi:addiction module HigA family antidote